MCRHDVALGLEIREDVDGGVGDEQNVGIGGHVEDKDVADAPPGAQPAVLCHDLVHQHVGVQAALHQALRLTVADQAHRGRRRFLLARDVHDRARAQVEAGSLRHSANALFGANQDRRDDLLRDGVDGTG
jgi:hypothetical protein